MQRLYGDGQAEAFRDGDVGLPMPGAAEAGRAPKTIIIRQADWLKHGGTTGCPKCIHARDFGWGKMGGPHSPACVTRFRKLFAETAEGKERLEHAQARHEMWMSRRRDGEDPAQVPPEEPRIQFEDDPAQLPATSQVPGAVEKEQNADDEIMNDQEDDEMFDAGSVGEQVPMTPEAVPMSADEQMGSLQPLTNIVTEDVMDHVQRYNKEILKLVSELGGGTRTYARERYQRLKWMVSELYSPPQGHGRSEAATRKQCHRWHGLRLDNA